MPYQVSVFAQTPYFAQYRQFAEFNPAISVWNASYEMSDQSAILEFVTSMFSSCHATTTTKHTTTTRNATQKDAAVVRCVQAEPLGSYAHRVNAVKFTRITHQRADPNNPDGTDRQPWYKEAHHVWDMVYHWPSMVNYSEPASHDIMLFSMSKLSGHAGTR